MDNGKQCTVAWYVDNNKILHVALETVTEVIELIEGHFGKMTVTRGKGMREYHKEAINEFGESVGKSAVLPATAKLFEILDSPELGHERRELLHSITAKLLYVSQQCRMDIQLAIAFLCSCVSCSTEEDWSKLKRVLTYINGLLDEYRFIGADNISKMKTWINASYAVHQDMKSHTGGVISFGTGAALKSKSTKQKLNIKSSTEAELVGASDYLPNAIWTKNFLEAQGHDLTETHFTRTTRVLSSLRRMEEGHVDLILGTLIQDIFYQGQARIG